MKYLIAFKNGTTQIVKGRVMLFSTLNITNCYPQMTGVVYVNADEVLSIVEHVEDEE